MKRLRALVNKDYFFVFLFALISLFALTWFHGEDFVLAGDSGWPLNFERFFELTTSVWDSSVAPGYNAPRQTASLFPYATYGVITSRLGLSSSVFQKIVYAVSFFFSGYGFYLLSRSFGLKKLGSLVSGLFYMLSPYALIVVWNPSYGLTFPFYAYLPLCVYFVRRYLISEGKVLSRELVEALFILTFSFFGAALSNPVYLMLYVGVLALLTLYILTIELPDKRSLLIKRSLSYFLFLILLSSFWLLPSILKTDYVSSDNVSYGLVDDHHTQFINSVYFKDGLRALGLWTMFSTHFGEYYYTFNSIWTHPLYVLLSVIPILLGVHYILKSKDKSGILLLFLYVFALALNSGLRAPRFFENFMQPFLSLPLISRAIRSVYLKLGFLLVVPLALLFGKKVDELKIRPAIVAALIGMLIFSYPFFRGDILRDHGENMPGYSVSIPSDYSSVLGDLSTTDRVLVYPIPPSYNYQLDWGDRGYIGADFLRNLTDASLYYIGNRPLAHYFADTLDINVLRDLSIDYILVRKDIFANEYKDYLTDDPNLFNERILSDSRILLSKETQYLDLYEVSEELKNPLIYASEAESNYIKTSSYRYVVNVSSEGEKLVFSESFDPDWIAFHVDSEGTKQLLGGHDVINGYANSWDLQNTDPLTIVIEFKAQKNFVAGLWMSTLTIVFLGFLYLRRLRDE